jgi:hypothetical protein
MTKIRSSSTSGQPAAGRLKFNWPQFRRPLRPLRSLPTRIVNDVASGVTQPEARNMTTTHGVRTPGAGGYKGATVRHQTPQTPPGTGANQTRVQTPRSRLRKR